MMALSGDEKLGVKKNGQCQEMASKLLGSIETGKAIQMRGKLMAGPDYD
jgi:hypothetical protein